MPKKKITPLTASQISGHDDDPFDTEFWGEPDPDQIDLEDAIAEAVSEPNVATGPAPSPSAETAPKDLSHLLDTTPDTLANAVPVRAADTEIVVYDGEAHTLTTSTPERQHRAQTLLRLYRAATVVQAVALREMKTEGYHLELGYATWKDFCEVALEIGERKARQLVQIAESFGELTIPDGAGGHALTEQGEAWSALGIGKLRALAQLPEASLDLDNEIVTREDGSTMPLSEIKAKTKRDIEKMVREEKKLMRERLGVVSEEAALMRAERDTLKEREAVAEEKYQIGRSLERQFSAKASLLEDKRRALTEARSYFDKFRSTLKKCGIEPDDPSGLRLDLYSLIRDANERADSLKTDFYEVLHVVDTELN